MGHRHRRHRHTRRLAGRGNLRLELVALNTSAPTTRRDARFVWNSVHVSTKKLGGHEAPTKTENYQGAAASRLPRARDPDRRTHVAAGCSRTSAGRA